MVPSPYAAATRVPSGLNATAVTGPEPDRSAGPRSVPVAVTHSRTVPSPYPAATRVPSGLNATEVTPGEPGAAGLAAARAPGEPGSAGLAAARAPGEPGSAGLAAAAWGPARTAVVRANRPVITMRRQCRLRQ